MGTILQPMSFTSNSLGIYIIYNTWLLNFTSLVLDELPKYSEYREPAFKQVLDSLKKTCRTSLSRLEKLKPIISQDYRRYVASLESTTIPTIIPTTIPTTTIIPTTTTTINNKTKLEQKNDSPKRNFVMETLPPYDPNWSVAQALPDFKRKTFSKPTIGEHSWTKATGGQTEPFKPYPTILDVVCKEVKNPKETKLLQRPAPSLPINQVPLQVPLLPSKDELPSDLDGSKSTTLYNDSTFIGGYTEGGSPLRTILLPETLISRFLEVARANTSRNLETCGILCGCVERGIFRLSHLLIPPQTATSDTCTTNNEEDLVLYQSTHDLLTLGWIHTHPTQSCFLSSVDLHTQLGYQLMLPEAIAVVCAPSENSFGTYRLTDPPGLPYITQCNHPSAFHPHDLSTNDLYMEATDGHVQFKNYLDFQVVDLRQ